eukprot:802055-Prorocentrum_minimum.AAC.2
MVVSKSRRTSAHEAGARVDTRSGSLPARDQQRRQEENCQQQNNSTVCESFFSPSIVIWQHDRAHTRPCASAW